MHSATRKLALILLTIVLLPLVFYVNREEQMLREIYNRQLESVLFSINQYSNDFISKFADNVEKWNATPGTAGLQNYIDLFPAPIVLAVSPTLQNEIHIFSNYESNMLPFEYKTDSIFDSNLTTINRLQTYRETGYRKLEPVGEVQHNGKFSSALLFTNQINGEWGNYVLYINPVDFVLGILGPKLQEIAGEDFLIQVRRTKGRSDLLFATDSVKMTEFRTTKLWDLSGYEIAITLKEKSITEVVKKRTQINLVAVTLLSVVLIIGFWLILRNLNREVQLAQTKSDFVSNVSHEIRTPLSLISMFAETLLLDRVPNEEKKKEYYDIITKETARLRKIVNKILNFSKIEAGKKTYNLRTVNLNNTLKDVMSTYTYHLKQNNFEYHANLHPDLPNIHADEEAIIEAIINLLDNAIKYSPKEKRIVAETGIKNDFAFVQISDSGIGIEAKKKRQIFDKFYRISRGDVHETDGTGLGLSLVKHIMDAHSGKVEIDSELGKGSTFRLLFPRNN